MVDIEVDIGADIAVGIAVDITPEADIIRGVGIIIASNNNQSSLQFIVQNIPPTVNLYLNTKGSEEWKQESVDVKPQVPDIITQVKEERISTE